MNKRAIGGLIVGVAIPVLVIMAIYNWVNWYRTPSTHVRTEVRTTRTSALPLVPAHSGVRCSGVAKTATFGGSAEPINTSQCQLRAYVIAGCGSWYDASGNRLAYSCKGPMPSIDGIVAFRADTSATLRINHCEPWTPGTSVDTCS